MFDIKPTSIDTLVNKYYIIPLFKIKHMWSFEVYKFQKSKQKGFNETMLKDLSF